MKIWRSCAVPWRLSKRNWTTDLLKANYIKISFHIKVSDLCRILFSFPAPPFSPLRGKSLPPLPCCPMANALAVTGRTPPANRRIPTRFRAALSPAFDKFRLSFVRHLLHLLDEFRLGFVRPLSPFPDEFRLDFVQRSPLPSTNSDLVSCTHASLFQLISDLVSCRLLSISCRNRNAFPQKLT